MRVLREAGPKPTERLNHAFRLVLVRQPRPEELGPLLTLYSNHYEFYKAHPDDAAKLLAVGESPLHAEIDQADLAATTSLMRVILNLHETVTRY